MLKVAMLKLNLLMVYRLSETRHAESGLIQVQNDSVFRQRLQCCCVHSWITWRGQSCTLSWLVALLASPGESLAPTFSLGYLSLTPSCLTALSVIIIIVVMIETIMTYFIIMIMNLFDWNSDYRANTKMNSSDTEYFPILIYWLQNKIVKWTVLTQLNYLSTWTN